MNLKRKPLTIFVALLMFGLPLDVVWGSANAKSAGNISQTKIAFENQITFADEWHEPSIIGDVLALSDSTLDEMRGGFTTTSGLEVTFGIERMLYVNGELISTTSLNVVNLANVSVTPVVPVAADVIEKVPELSSPTIALPQPNAVAPVTSTAMPDNVASSSAATAPTGTTTTTATTTTTSAASASSNASASTPITSVTTTSGSVALIKSGAGNTVSPGTFSTSSLGTVVQNTLNNQKIQNVAVISATVNSMEILKALNLQSAISSAVNDAVRK